MTIKRGSRKLRKLNETTPAPDAAGTEDQQAEPVNELQAKVNAVLRGTRYDR